MLHEPPYTRRYWLGLERRGTLIYEFEAVAKSAGESEPRKIDGVILPDVPSVTVEGVTRDEWHWEGLSKGAKEVLRGKLKGQRIICIQTKADRGGFCLMGQSIFSPRLLEFETFSPRRPVKSVAVCGGLHPTLLDLLENKYGVTVHVDSSPRRDGRWPNRKESEGSVAKDAHRIRSYWKNLGRGSLAFDYPLLQESPKSVLSAHAVIWLNGPHREVGYKELPEQLNAEDEVTVVTTRLNHPRPGMCSMGRALFAWELMKLKHPACKVDTAIPCGGKDASLEVLLKRVEFEHIDIKPTEYRPDCLQ